jgi:hypothetical protein
MVLTSISPSRPRFGIMRWLQEFRDSSGNFRVFKSNALYVLTATTWVDASISQGCSASPTFLIISLPVHSRCVLDCACALPSDVNPAKDHVSIPHRTCPRPALAELGLATCGLNCPYLEHQPVDVLSFQSLSLPCCLRVPPRNHGLRPFARWNLRRQLFQ